MSRAMRVRAGLAGILTSMLLSACGGGGDGAAAPVAPTVPPTAIPDGLSISAAASSDVASATAFSSSAAALQGLSFAWSFGDGGSSAEASPKHDYAKVGDYEVTLKVSNTAGVSKEVKFKVSVNNRAHVRGLACSAASDSGWCWQQPRPTGTVPTDLFFLDTQTGWSVGDNGEILKTVNGGQTWAKQSAGVRTPLWSVRFADASNGWAIGAFGAVLRSTDGGANWALQAAGFTDNYGLTLYVIDAKTAVIASSTGRIRVTDDGGASWTERIFKLDAVGADGVLWGLSGAALKRSTDLGRTSSDVLAVSDSYGSRLQVMGRGVLLSRISSVTDPSTYQTSYKLNIQRSLDAGGTWESYEGTGLPTQWLYISGLGFTDATVGTWTNGSDLYRSADGGRTWAKTALPASGFYSYEARMLPGGAFYRRGYAGSGEVHYLSEDGGASWRSVKSPFVYTLGSRIQRLDAQTWLSSDYGSVMLSRDGMQSWTAIAGIDPKVAQRSLLAVWFFDAKRGLGLNAAGELQETANGGLDWTVKLKNLATASYGIATRFQFVSASKGWLLAGDGKIYRSTDGGALWSTPLLGAYQVSSFHFADENNGFALSRDPATGRSVLLVSSDGGQSWAQKAEIQEGLNALHFSDASKGIAVGANGRIATTEDGGQTWVNRFSGSSASLARIAFSEPGVAWVVGDGGTVLNSRDAGATWSQVGLGSTGALTNLQFLDAQRGWLVGSGGTILSTQDGGKTWSAQFSGTQKSLSGLFFVDARTGWVLGAEGTILATGTGGV